MPTTPGSIQIVKEVETTTVGDAAPTPPAGSLEIFANQNDTFYKKTSAGVVSPLVLGVTSLDGLTGVIPTGSSVIPVSGSLEIAFPVQAQVTGTSKVWATSDMDKYQSRANSGVAMTDTMPTGSATVNGMHIIIANEDTAGAITLTAAGAQTFVSATGVAGASTFTLKAGRRTQFVWYQTGGYWRILQNNNNLTKGKSGSTFTTGNLVKSSTNTDGSEIDDAGVATSIDGALTSNSDAKLPTEKAVKTYADTKQPLDTTLTNLAAQNWVANAIPIGTGADTVGQTTFAANTFPGRTSSGNLVAKTLDDAGASFLAASGTAGETALLDNATFALKGLQTAAEKIAQNSIDGRTSTGTNPRVFRPGDYMVGNTYDPTGSSNSTTSFAAMMTALRAFNDRAIIQLPPGVFKIDPGTLASFGAAKASCAIVGPGRGVCVLIPSATGDFITLPSGLTGADSFTVSGFTIYNTSGTPFTTGAGINVNGCANVLISELAYIDLFYDVNVNGAAIKVSMQKMVHYQTNGNASSVGIIVNNGAAGDTYIGPDVVMSNGGGTRRRASVEIIASGHYEINQANLTGSAQGILIDPGAGQIVSFGFHNYVLCDSCTGNGMTLNATTATSTIKNIKSTTSWYSGTITGGGAGVLTTGTAGGIINGVTFDNDRFLNNQTHGFQHGFGTDFRWDACDMKGNSAAASNTSDGLNIAAGVSNWAVNGGKYGGTDTAPTGGNQRWGIFVAVGANSSASIIGADLSGNNSGPLSNGSTSTIDVASCAGLPVVPNATTPASLVAGVSTENYVTQAFPLPLGSLQIGNAWKCTIYLTSSATAQVLSIRTKFGTAGTIADGNIVNAATVLGTAVIGAAILEVWFQVKALGNGTTAIASQMRLTNGVTGSNSSAVGITQSPAQHSQATVATFNSTVANFMGVGLLSSVSNVITVQSCIWEEVSI